MRQGLRFLRAELPRILAEPCDALSPRMLRVIEDLAGDWRRLDERIEGLSSAIEALARQDEGCARLMTVPGIGPIIASAMVAAIGRKAVVGLDRTGMPSCPGAANETSPPRPSFPEGSILPPPPGQIGVLFRRPGRSVSRRQNVVEPG